MAVAQQKEDKVVCENHIRSNVKKMRRFKVINFPPSRNMFCIVLGEEHSAERGLEEMGCKVYKHVYTVIT